MKHLRQLFLFLVFAILSACTKTPPPEPEFEAFAGLRSSRRSTLETIIEDQKKFYESVGYDVDELVEQYSSIIGMTSLLPKSFTAYDILYKTVDPFGKPVIASGMVYFPEGILRLGVMEMFSFNVSWDGCATRKEPLEAAFAIGGYVAIIPDLAGFGATEGSMPPAYLINDNAARMMADLRKAAEEFLLYKRNYKMPSSSRVFGYSLGAPYALALARFYGQHPERNVKVTKLFTGGGPYYVNLVMQYYMDHTYCNYALYPGIILSADHYYQLNLPFKDIFKGPLAEHYSEWCDGSLPAEVVTERIGSYVNENLDFGFFNESNPSYISLKQAFDEMSYPEDWVPDCPVKLYVGTEDGTLGRSCSDKLYEWLSDAGADVEYHVLEGKNHITAFIDIAGDFLKDSL